MVEDAAIVGNGHEIVPHSSDLNAAGGGVGGFVGCAAAEINRRDGLGEIGFEVLVVGDARGEVFVEKAAGGHGVVDGAEAVEGEIAKTQFHGVADHHGASEDGAGDGGAGDDGEVGEAEVGEGAKE